MPYQLVIFVLFLNISANMKTEVEKNPYEVDSGKSPEASISRATVALSFIHFLIGLAT
jgi:hypothetical protein